MTVRDIALASMMLLAALGLFVVSAFQFREKGFLFNNAFLFATRKERETMCKKPHYRQSAIVFLLLGIVFLLNAVEMLVRSKWLFYASMAVVAAALVYAVVSSIRMETKRAR